MNRRIIMEIGIDSFAEAKQNNGRTYSENSAQSISELLDRIEHADKVGLDVFGIGEHYRREFLCLLYTSPSPRDATLSRMPSSA